MHAWSHSNARVSGDPDDNIDWSKTTFKGSRRDQLRRWCSLTLRQRLEALDRLTVPVDLRFGRSRRSEGSDYTNTIRQGPRLIAMQAVSVWK